jgi:hypothetical protein
MVTRTWGRATGGARAKLAGAPEAEHHFAGATVQFTSKEQTLQRGTKVQPQEGVRSLDHHCSGSALQHDRNVCMRVFEERVTLDRGAVPQWHDVSLRRDSPVVHSLITRGSEARCAVAAGT